MSSDSDQAMIPAKGKSIAAAVVVSALMAGCRSDGLTAEQRAARQAASEFVGHVIGGDATTLAAASADIDSCDAQYRQVIADVMAEHIAAMASRRGGIATFAVRGDTIVGSAAQVFVELVFADSTSEEIDIPITLVGDAWKLR